eukprot:gene5913-3927_t
MGNHLKSHTAGLIAGRLPDAWMRDHDKIFCPMCGMICAMRNQCCTHCWPQRRAAASKSQVAVEGDLSDLPPFEAVQADDIPTLKHVPQQARNRWARALRDALGKVEQEKSLAAVIELAMLPKCVMCVPPSGRGGRQHRKQTARYTLDRLDRWERGDRLQLWADAPRATRKQRPAKDDEAAATARAARAEDLAREGLWSKAASALLDSGVAEPTNDARDELSRLHPRRAVLAAVRERFPQLLHWTRWCYGQKSDLQFGGLRPLSSEEGVQQGDPLGPLLFALAIHPLIERIKGEVDGLDYIQFYLDDGAICGPADAVAAALELITTAGPALGLKLNLAKSELIVPSGVLDHTLRALFPAELLVGDVGEDRVILSANFHYLGSPIGDPAHCSTFAQMRTEDVSKILERVSSISDTEVAFKIMKHCVNYGRMMHLMRTVPSEHVPDAFSAFDDEVCAAFSRITGIWQTPAQWERATRSTATAG